MSKKTDQNIKQLALIFPSIQRFFHNISIEVSKTGEFTIAQYRALSLLDHFRQMTVNDLKSHLNIAQSSASGLVERLEQLGLIERKSDKKDKRVTVLNLSPKAKKILKKNNDSMDGVYKNILEQMDYNDQKLFIDSFRNLTRLIEKMEQKK